MSAQGEEWRPGSFTKNFSWGRDRGLVELYAMIRAGFAGTPENVPREVFRQRVKGAGRPDFIPLNFFLYNKVIDDVSHVMVDELVFQALAFPHAARFDRLALFAFLFSLAGCWNWSESWQSRPALWAQGYVIDRVAGELAWDTAQISARDIEAYVGQDPRYRARSARKLATNFNHLLKIGGIAAFASVADLPGWMDLAFLALDRILDWRASNELPVDAGRYGKYLRDYRFHALVGWGGDLASEQAIGRAVELYQACGGLARFSAEGLAQRSALSVDDLAGGLAEASPPPGGRGWPDGADTGRAALARAAAMLVQASGCAGADPGLAGAEALRLGALAALAELAARGAPAGLSVAEAMAVLQAG